MNRIALLAMTAMTVSVSTGCSAHGLRPDSVTIVVESPADLPVLAHGGTDMFLHDTTNGKTYLYVEASDGQQLSILDVTDAADIRAVAQAPLAAAAAFDYVQDINQVGTLVKYRGDGSLAVLDFSRYNRPAIHQAAPLATASVAESIGDRGLLLTSYGSKPPVSAELPHAVGTYDVMDTAHGGNPALIASVPGVTRRVTKTDTGTIFLLADNGVTVVRNLQAEEAHALELSAAKQ